MVEPDFTQTIRDAYAGKDPAAPAIELGAGVHDGAVAPRLRFGSRCR